MRQLRVAVGTVVVGLVAMTACTAAVVPTSTVVATRAIATPSVADAVTSTPAVATPSPVSASTPVPPADSVVPTAIPPTPSPIPPTATLVRLTSVPATFTPAKATSVSSAPLTASQIAATAVASAAGEECVAAPPKPAKGFIGNPVLGKTLFVQRGCSACHGDQAQGNVGPKLAGTTLSFGAVIQQLREPRGVMQRYLPADQSDADECDVYTYVRSLKP